MHTSDCRNRNRFAFYKRQIIRINALHCSTFWAIRDISDMLPLLPPRSALHSHANARSDCLSFSRLRASWPRGRWAIDTALATNAVRPSEFERVNVDPTVQAKAVAIPTGQPVARSSPLPGRQGGQGRGHRAQANDGA